MVTHVATGFPVLVPIARPSGVSWSQGGSSGDKHNHGVGKGSSPSNAGGWPNSPDVQGAHGDAGGQRKPDRASPGHGGGSGAGSGSGSGSGSNSGWDRGSGSHDGPDNWGGNDHGSGHGGGHGHTGFTTTTTRSNGGWNAWSTVTSTLSVHSTTTTPAVSEPNPTRETSITTTLSSTPTTAGETTTTLVATSTTTPVFTSTTIDVAQPTSGFIVVDDPRLLVKRRTLRYVAFNGIFGELVDDEASAAQVTKYADGSMKFNDDYLAGIASINSMVLGLAASQPVWLGRWNSVQDDGAITLVDSPGFCLDFSRYIIVQTTLQPPTGCTPVRLVFVTGTT